MRSVLCLTLVFTPAAAALACSNYSQTHWDDRAVREALDSYNDAAFALISRQFPHHGRAYWATLEQESLSRVASGEDDSMEARADLAVAVLKQGRFAEARRLLLELDSEQPERYRTLSNLGVLEKKAGRYAKGAAYLERALAVKPGGHMGLGDFYLRACRWQAGASRVTPSKDFLGNPYDTPRRSWEGVNLTFLRTLIHNDRDFPDVYLVYGDRLLSQGEPLLAGYAYAQARRLGHPASQALDQRMATVCVSLLERSRRSVMESREAAVRGTDEVALKDRLPQVVSPIELERVLTHWLTRTEEWSAAFERRQEGLLSQGTSAAGLKSVNSGFQRAQLGAGVAVHQLVTYGEPESFDSWRWRSPGSLLTGGFLFVGLVLVVRRRRR